MGKFYIFSGVAHYVLFFAYLTELMKITNSIMDFIGLGYINDLGGGFIISLGLTLIWTIILSYVLVELLSRIPALIQIIKEKQMGN
ncbi:hypothetical protein ABKP09_19650 [Peribacillus frigoritolerans]|uniref:hypothetical protein n=1 Tax=Peribacillus frigoritolerans TaxID=450367 RepID=UPI0032B5AE7D